VSDAARIAALHYYPLKSARGIELERARLTNAGFEDDRRWMLVSGAGRFLTQRELPRLALLQARPSPDALLLAAPQRPQISIPLSRQGERRTVTVWRDQCQAFDEGDEVAAWLQAYLGRECRLVRFDPAHRRLSEREWTGGFVADVRFADGFPMLAINTASLVDLNSRLPAPLPLDRFRANIVLTGLQPYDEDRIDELYGDGVRLRMVKACTRCRITTTNQDSGEVEGEEPLRTLRQYRYDPGLHGVCFGQNAIVVEGAGNALMQGQRLSIRWRDNSMSG
jgi:uncharacterized protein YcbX